MEIDKCRLCQINIGSRRILDSEEFVHKIMYCTNIQINDDLHHHLPTTVCTECEDSIAQFFVYLQKIRLVDKKLHEQFSVSSQLLDNNVCSNDIDCKCSVCVRIYSRRYETRSYSTGINMKEKDFVKQSSNKQFYNTQGEDFQSAGRNTCTPPSTGVLKDQVTGASYLSTVEDLYTSKDNSIEEQEPFACDFCNKKFLLLQDLHTHKEIHVSKFRCSYMNCIRICSSAYSLRTHLMKHEGKKSFLCITCGKGFVTKNSLTCHEKIHASVKKYSCKECNIGFSVSSNLRAHQRKHHEGIKFYCSQCPRTFIAKCSLQRHELLHSGYKEFKCKLCPAEFYTPKELSRHQRYHQGVRSYKCGQCFKTFFEKHHLTIHIRCHFGERPYLCTIANCKKSFTESQKLTRHMKSVHIMN